MRREEHGGIEDPTAVLDRRLASGEIDRAEYEEIRKAMLYKRPSGAGRRNRALSTSGITILIVLGVVLAFAFTSMALTYGPWRTSQDGTWPWGGCCTGGSHGGMMGDDMGDHMGMDVAIVDYAYSPQEITVAVGSTVTWVNMDQVMHTVSFGAHGEEHGDEVESGPMYHMDAFSYTFPQPGVYEYHCDPHPYMTGKVIVEG